MTVIEDRSTPWVLSKTDLSSNLILHHPWSRRSFLSPSFVSGFSTLVSTSLLFHIEIIRPEVFKYSVILSCVKDYKQLISSTRDAASMTNSFQHMPWKTTIHTSLGWKSVIMPDHHWWYLMTGQPNQQRMQCAHTTVNGVLLWKAGNLPTNTSPSLHVLL